MSSRYLTNKDRGIVEGVQLFLAYRSEQVEFQFPPTIENDSRRVNWTTENLPGKDPLAIYSNNSAREMTLKLEYIVEDPSLEILGNIWTIGRIKRQINLLKGYFSGLQADAAGFVAAGTMTAYFIHTYITGTSAWSVRIGNVNVTYDGPQIGPGPLSYPLKTIVNVDIATVSSGSGTEEVYWDGLKQFPEFDDLWY